MELESEKSLLHIVSKKNLETQPITIGNNEARRQLKKEFLIRMAVLGDIILRDKDLKMSHVRDITKLLGQITKTFDL